MFAHSSPLSLLHVTSKVVVPHNPASTSYVLIIYFFVQGRPSRVLSLVLHYSCLQLRRMQWIVLSIDSASYSDLTTIEFQHFRLRTGNCKDVLVFLRSG